MPVLSIESLPGALAPASTIAGLDVGSRTIGVAVSDRDWRFAHPRPVIARRKFGADWERLEAAVDAEGVGALIVGLPLHLDGGMSPSAQAARAFASNVLRRRDMPIAFWDERLSTIAAERALLEMDVSRSKRAGRIDSAAAAFILQGALDRLVAL